jgi:hypothetical protein
MHLTLHTIVILFRIASKVFFFYIVPTNKSPGFSIFPYFYKHASFNKVLFFATFKIAATMPLENITNDTPVIRKQLSYEVYSIIIGRFEAGQAAATISKQMKLPDSTVRDAIQRWKKFGTTVPAKHTGRPEKLKKKKKKHTHLCLITS